MAVCHAVSTIIRGPWSNDSSIATVRTHNAHPARRNETLRCEPLLGVPTHICKRLLARRDRRSLVVQTTLSVRLQRRPVSSPVVQLSCLLFLARNDVVIDTGSTRVGFFAAASASRLLRVA